MYNKHVNNMLKTYWSQKKNCAVLILKDQKILVCIENNVNYCDNNMYLGVILLI